MAKAHIGIVGAGPGGLTAAMILAHRGFKVSVFEKEEAVGGRNAELRLGPYSFDIGPTFLLMKYLLDEMFEEAGRRSDDYLDCRKLDPMYDLVFEDFTLHATTDREKMRAEIERAFPGQGAGLDKFHKAEKVRYERMYPCLQKDYGSLRAMVAPVLLRALPHLSMGRSIFQVLGHYFEPELLRLAFTFQSKYLGMSPWDCPGAFALIPYAEHVFGIYHVMGGLNRMSHAFAKVLQEEGGELHLKTPVRRLTLDGRKVTGLELADGEKVRLDATIINADFGHAMSHLVPEGVLRRYRPDKLRRRDFSCSTFMLYLGLDTTYPLAHHSIIFARDYARNLREISHTKVLSEDISFYIRNATVTDAQIAPSGHSAIYVLVPTPNNSSRVDWTREKSAFRERVLDAMEQRADMPGLRDHIRAEYVITPADWEDERSVFLGATFNLAHSLGQMLYFRPHNEFEELRNCYLVGGGTHPGSGIPTILESARITSNLISRRWAAPFKPPPPFTEEYFERAQRNET
jgi:phytoene desaturase